MISLEVNPWAFTRGMVSAKMKEEAGTPGIAWREWSKEAFDEARNTGKLVLLDLSADWCHWCHVMDRTTYSDPEVIEAVNSGFVPVRVDIDARPDISERYNRGGFPTTAFLSDRGESVWGATYIPPKDMRRIIVGILSAKSSGEVADALEKSRMVRPSAPRGTGSADPVDDGLWEAVFEDIFATYDVEHGGFGLYPKFPHPDVLDLVMLRYQLTGDEGLAEAATHTIKRMTNGLYDKVEGGVFRYSVTRDWNEPHYEKMLETNACFLKNLTTAYKVFGSAEHAETASGVARFLLDILRDRSSGGFHGSQDADEEYYRHPAELRALRNRPAVVRVVYGGWNAMAVSALVEAGAVFRSRDWLDAGMGGWGYALSRLWNQDMGLMRHEDHVDLYLFEDQVSFIEALLSVYSVTGSAELLELGQQLVRGVEGHFAHPDGGYADIVHEPDAIGELSERRRPLVANSRYARLLALLSVAAHDQGLAERPRRILSSFSRWDLEAHGLFAAEYLISSHVLDAGAKVVTIHADGGPDPLSNSLWSAAKRAHNPAVLCAIGTEGRARGGGATICTSSGCSEVIKTPEELTRRLRVERARQT